MTTFHATVNHFPEHFNITCNATIPEYWECELDEIPLEAYPTMGAPSPHMHLRMYGTGETRQLAIDDLVDQLKGHNLHGTLKIAG